MLRNSPFSQQQQYLIPEVWELKVYFYPSAGGFFKKIINSNTPVIIIPGTKSALKKRQYHRYKVRAGLGFSPQIGSVTNAACNSYDVLECHIPGTRHEQWKRVT